MKKAILHTIPLFSVLLTALLALTSCGQEREEAAAPDGEATLVLSLGDARLFTELTTRAERVVTDYSRYTFTLNGTTISGAPVVDLVVPVGDDGIVKVAAGSYTLSADNHDYANADNGHPWYTGTSELFTIDVNETLNVAIALGKPKNARITVAVDDSFTALYDDPVVTLSDGERSVTMTSSEDVCHFIIPASGALAYTITAAAKAGSHATDMASSTGFVEIQAGYNTTVRLKAHPASGIIIPVVDGGHAGQFD